MQQYLIDASSYNPEEEISKLEMPVLIVQGTNDIQIEIKDAQLLHNAAKKSRIEIIQGMNHVFRQAPENRLLNMQTYGNPELSIDDSLVNLIVWFFIDENKERRKIYLQGMYLNGERKIINIESNRLMSHYCWIDDQTILGVNRSEDLTWKYTEYDLLTNSYFDLNINSGFDGHPMFSASSNKVIIDTTPDPNRFQHLLCFDRHKNKLFQIDKLLTSKYFQGQNRCDLHPRWNESSNMISVDTPIRNKRCQKIMILNQILDRYL